MNVEEFREYCLSLKGVEEKMPFVNIAVMFCVSMWAINGFVL